jgi:DNA-binding response OmpR family regulator
VEIAGAHALILDDDTDVRALVRRILSGAGMIVAEAHDVETAFQVAAQQAPHVILSDLNLPGQSGFAFIERCRKTQWMRDVPIIVLSAQSDSASVHRAVSLGASEYMLKPFQAAALTQKLRKVLRDRDIKRFTFAPGAEKASVSLKLSVPCLVTEIGETGLRVEAPVRLACDALVEIDAPVVNDLKLPPDCMRGSKRSPVLRQEARYLSDAVFRGLDEAALQRVRRRVKEIP